MYSRSSSSVDLGCGFTAAGEIIFETIPEITSSDTAHDTTVPEGKMKISPRAAAEATVLDWAESIGLRFRSQHSQFKVHP